MIPILIAIALLILAAWSVWNSYWLYQIDHEEPANLPPHVYHEDIYEA
jgi:hypothetical protein